jgi:hypothetical protein
MNLVALSLLVMVPVEEGSSDARTMRSSGVNTQPSCQVSSDWERPPDGKECVDVSCPESVRGTSFLLMIVGDIATRSVSQQFESIGTKSLKRRVPMFSPTLLGLPPFRLVRETGINESYGWIDLSLLM